MTVSINLGAPDPEVFNTSNLVPEGKPEPQLREGGHTLSINGNSEPTRTGVAQITAADLGNGASGIVGTARTQIGSPRLSTALQPSDLVTLNGTQMTVDMAEKLGVISKNLITGHYSDGAPEAVANAQAEPQVAQAQDEAVAFSDAQAEGNLADLCGGTTAATQVSVMSQLVQSGEVQRGTIERAASELGVHPQEMSERIGHVREAFRAQAVQTIKGLGSDDPEDFFAWAHQERPAAMQKAMQQHAMERTAKGYEPLYRAYCESLGDRDPEAILTAQYDIGVTAQKVGNEVVLNIPGKGQISFKAAVRMGLVKVQGA